METDLSSLPPEIQSKLINLERELAEEEITPKGFEKKRSAILEEYRKHSSGSFSGDQSYIGGGGYDEMSEFTSTLPIQDLHISEQRHPNEIMSYDDDDYDHVQSQP